MIRTTAAKGTFLFAHRTVAEIDAEQEFYQSQIRRLDWISRRRELRRSESRALQRLMWKVNA